MFFFSFQLRFVLVSSFYWPTFFFSFQLSRPVKAGKCLSFGPFETKTSAFCSISRGEAEKHGFGAPFPGPFFPGRFRGPVRDGFCRFRPRFFFASGLQAGLFWGGFRLRFFFSFRPPGRGVFLSFPATFCFSFRLRGPSRPETKKNAPSVSKAH